MKRTLMMATLTLATTFGSLAVAQVPGGKPNFFPNKKVEITQPRQDDRWDLQRLQALEQRFASAQKKRWLNRGEVARIDAELQQYLTAELQEARFELASANEELKDQRRGKDYRGKVVDAKRDQQAERKTLQQLRLIDQQHEKLQGRYDTRSLNARATLIDQLVKLAKAELREGMNGRMARR